MLSAETPVYPYDQHTWGPKEVTGNVVPPRGWHTPTPEEPDDWSVVASEE